MVENPPYKPTREGSRPWLKPHEQLFRKLKKNGEEFSWWLKRNGEEFSWRLKRNGKELPRVLSAIALLSFGLSSLELLKTNNCNI
jgi:hypothetical protein